MQEPLVAAARVRARSSKTGSSICTVLANAGTKASSAAWCNVVIDEAQHRGDRFLVDLAGFLKVAMDSPNVLTMWLVGQPQLDAVLRMTRHAARPRGSRRW